MTPADRKPPFVVDYQVDGRAFSFLLLGPTSWAEAEAHLAAIAATAKVEGSDVVEIDAKTIDLWIELADQLLARQAGEMAITGAAVMAAGMIAAGFDRGAAAVSAAAMLDQVYAMEKGE